ncbi:hypothetical protein SAMN06264849_11657 [Melghirimyces algeriensis]|uniref:Uncharacterized protein n=1 Tax=Melghirimyces algeriensis TaxID=910412 RepID=A0A521FEM6_9BACL|nr:hypothetical protein SAMN06264849_11657 [Melghirimyces algeriensis]
MRLRASVGIGRGSIIFMTDFHQTFMVLLQQSEPQGGKGWRLLYGFNANSVDTPVMLI